MRVWSIKFHTCSQYLISLSISQAHKLYNKITNKIFHGLIEIVSLYEGQAFSSKTNCHDEAVYEVQYYHNINITMTYLLDTLVK